jgi:uncharacterized protein YndB with AHSA1/START domain
MAEVTIEDEMRVDAPALEVWRAIEDPVAHADWHPYVVRITGEHRVGASRSCAVLVGKKTGETRERCLEADAQRAITWAIDHDTTGFSRMVADWQAGFSLLSQDDGTVVTARSVFRPRNLAVRAMTPLIRRRFHSTQRAILASLKRYVESAPGG